MSIIIRLQNLPLLAKTGDIRNFFCGLQIPDGGVYITGGELGNAFIAFTSDDDARLAMQKNGYKIMDAPVQLYLSSHSEMQQEIARITKQKLDASHQRSLDRRTIIDDYGGSNYGSKSPSRRTRGYCRSPSPRMRSRSPRKSSKSSEMSSPTRRSRSRSLDRDTGMFSDHHLGRSLVTEAEILGSVLSGREIKSEFGPNSSAALNAGINYLGEMGNLLQQPAVSLPNKGASICGLAPILTCNMNASKGFASSVQSLPHTIPLTPSTNTSPMVDLPPPTRVSTPPIPSMENPLPCSSFSPVNMCNLRDFTDLLSHKTYFHKYKWITVSVCPVQVFNKHFTCETPSDGSLNSERGIYYYEIKGFPIGVIYQDILDFFEGLEIIDLYIAFKKDRKGRKIFSKAKETAFVAFHNKSDYQKALSKNGKRFNGTNRNVVLRSITQEKVFWWKKKYKDLLLQSKSFVPVQDGGPVPGIVEGAFYAILTGLPKTISTKKIFSSFIRSGVRPGKIHISLDDKQQCDSRAFVEFKSSEILKKACNCDGRRMKKFVMSVKQISYKEMVKVFDSQKFKQNNLSQPETPRSHKTPDTCLDRNSAQQFSQEESFPKTVVTSKRIKVENEFTSKSIKVENEFDSAEVEPQRIPF